MPLIPQGPKVYFPRFTFTLLRSSSNLNPNQAVFRVPKVMNKYDIEQYLQKIYGLNIQNVQTMLYARESKRVGRYSTVKASWKKAIVTLDHEFKHPEAIKESRK
jgi:ribosomal protein L23